MEPSHVATVLCTACSLLEGRLSETYKANIQIQFGFSVMFTFVGVLCFFWKQDKSQVGLSFPMTKVTVSTDM